MSEDRRYSSLVAKTKLDTGSKNTVAEQFDKWLYELYSTVKDLQEQVIVLKAENAELKKKSTIDVGKQMTDFFSKENTKDSPFNLNIAKKFDSHLQRKSKIENNIAINGIVEKTPNDDEKQVKDLLTIVDIDHDKVNWSNLRRIKTNSKQSSKPKLELIVVEFKEQKTQQLALSNSRKPRDTEFSKVYLNPDRTAQERQLDKSNRDDRNAKNKELPNADEGERRQRYGVEEKCSKKGFRYHYGIRFSEVIKIYERPESKSAREAPASSSA